METYRLMKNRIKILFVCHGNICRSPMAQYVFQKMVDEADLSDFFEIESAATSTEEIGNPVYPPAFRTLQSHGIKNITHRARQMSSRDYRHFNLIKVMDSYNMRNASFMTDGDPDKKISLLLENEIIDDPWYTGDFAGVYKQIERGCRQLLNEITDFVGMDKEIFPVYSALFDSWCCGTCAPRMQERWTNMNRTLGQCSVTAFLVQDILGGDVYGTMLDDGNLHCYNVINGKTYDLTSAQLDTTADYSKGTIQSREVHFSKKEKYNRYLLLKKRYEEANEY